MGIKTFKQHFKIDYIVQKENNKILIGSAYARDLCSICMISGEITENPTFHGFVNEYLPELSSADKDTILKTLREIDSYESLVSVFTYDQEKIIEDKAEVFGWPNVTVSGKLMYSNTFFSTKKEALECAIRNNRSLQDLQELQLKEAEELVKEKQELLKKLKEQELILKSTTE